METFLASSSYISRNLQYLASKATISLLMLSKETYAVFDEMTYTGQEKFSDDVRARIVEEEDRKFIHPETAIIIVDPKGWERYILAAIDIDEELADKLRTNEPTYYTLIESYQFETDFLQILRFFLQPTLIQ